jgi:Tfp pilus assembly protein PilX
MNRKIDINQNGNGLVVVLAVVATILALLGAAVSYTSHISRISQRTRRVAVAMEIADGHLEYLFTNWRNIYRKTWTTYGYASGGTDYSVVGTNYFYTDL